RPAVQTLAGDFEPAEICMAQANHHAPHAAVANEQVRTPAEQSEVQAAGCAALQSRSEIRFRTGLDVEVGLAADAQRRALGERLVTLDHGVFGKRRGKFSE